MKKTFLSLAFVMLVFAAMAQDSKQTFTRKVLVEQFTTAQCGWCPQGAERITEVIGNSSNYIWIKHHAGFYTDDLTNDIHQAMLWFYGGSTYAPAVMLDRTHVDNSEPGPVFGISNVSDLRAKFTFAKNQTTYCKIYTPEISFNPESRTITGTVSGRFGDDVYTESTRLVVFLIEDSIFMEQHDYNHGSQANSYAVDYWHMGTVRATLTNMWGDPITVDVENNRTFSYDVNFTLTQAFNPKNCKIVAFMYNYDPSNYNNCQVMNAAASDFLTNTLAIGEIENNSQLRLFPNPATQRVVLEADAPIRNIAMVNTLGQTVLRRQGNGASTMHVDLNGLNAGMYLVRIQTDNGMATRQLIVK
ncbi:MAG: Omp28-related outer membrane protein [Bacteroidales bacterium]|nr:Omp28-related outer membrane protein [Bacteroidales bacterium]